MEKRIMLQNLLEKILGNRHVYFQPPASASMSYPAIKYSRSNMNVKHADDSIYLQRVRYEIIVTDRKPNNQIVEELLKLPYCSYDRGYKSNNLNHDVLTLYY